MRDHKSLLVIMNKIVKFLFYLKIFFLVSHCSFTNKGGVWDGIDDELRAAKLEAQQKEGKLVKIYSSQNPSLKEILPSQNISLTNSYKNLSWEMSSLNLQNFIGNLYLPKINNNFLKKKIGKNKFNIGSNIQSPLLFNGKLIFNDDTGSIFSVNNMGRILWKKNIYKKVYKKIYKNLSLTIYNKNIYVSDNIGFVYSIKADTGEINWIKNHGIPLKSNLIVFDDKIYVANQDNRILCLTAADGSLIWDIRAVSSFIKTENFIALSVSKKKNIIMLSSFGDLLNINAQNGQIYWSLNVAGSSSFSSDFFQSSEIVIAENNIIFSTSSAIFSINLTNGYVNWQRGISTKNTPVIDGNHIFLVSNDGYFLNINRDSGKIIWSTNILKILKKRKQKTSVTGFILGSGKIYSTTLNGFLIVSSATSGKSEYFKKIAKSIETKPIISNSSLYVLTKKSKILGFN